MAKSAPETILLRGDPNILEREAGGTITPGHLVALNSSNAFVVHPTAGGSAAPMFAVENDIAGDGITDTYASGENVRAHMARPGDQIYALLADGENVARGDLLESKGNGQLQKKTTDSVSAAELDSTVAQALEAVDLSASANTQPARIRAMVI